MAPLKYRIAPWIYSQSHADEAENKVSNNHNKLSASANIQRFW